MFLPVHLLKNDTGNVEIILNIMKASIFEFAI